MDVDELREETEAWVEAGVIDAEQADAIRDRYDSPDESGDGARGPTARTSDRGGETGYSRLVLAVSVMGSVLVGVGILWLLAEVWDGLPRLARTAILVAVPLGFAAGGHALLERNLGRVGHGLWFLAAVVVGPCLFELVAVWDLTVADEWLFLAWAGLALPAGHVRNARPTTAAGLVVATWLVFVIEEPAAFPFAVGLFGVLLFATGLYARHPETPLFEQGRHLSGVYRAVGCAVVVLTLLALILEERSYDTAAVELDAVVLFAGLATLGAVAGSWVLERRGTLRPVEAGWITVGALALAVPAAAVSLVPAIPALLALVLAHLCLLGAVVATVAVGVEARTPALVNLAAVAFFLQLLVFVETRLLDALTGATALVVVGLVLIVAAVALERGRRQILERIAA